MYLVNVLGRWEGEGGREEVYIFSCFQGYSPMLDTTLDKGRQVFMHVLR
jgi:hypothetical protein